VLSVGTPLPHTCHVRVLHVLRCLEKRVTQSFVVAVMRPVTFEINSDSPPRGRQQRYAMDASIRSAEYYRTVCRPTLTYKAS
jgi:hypothetical protein